MIRHIYIIFICENMILIKGIPHTIAPLSQFSKLKKWSEMNRSRNFFYSLTLRNSI